MRNGPEALRQANLSCSDRWRVWIRCVSDSFTEGFKKKTASLVQRIPLLGPLKGTKNTRKSDRSHLLLLNTPNNTWMLLNINLQNSGFSLCHDDHHHLCCYYSHTITPSCHKRNKPFPPTNQSNFTKYMQLIYMHVLSLHIKTWHVPACNLFIWCFN